MVVAFGAALNQWTTRHGTLIAPDARVAQVDLDADAIGAHRPVDLGVVGDAAAEALRGPRRSAPRRVRAAHGRGGRRTARSPPRSPPAAGATSRTRTPRRRAGSTRARSPSRSTTCCRSSAPWSSTPATSWAGRRCTCASRTPPASSSRRRSSASGSRLGNAIGAALARPGPAHRRALGDGGALMALPELETLGRLRLPLLVVIYDDAGLRRRGAPLPADGPGGRPRAVPRHRLRGARRGGRLPRRHGPQRRRPRGRARVARRTATARWCSTRRSTPTSARTGSRRPSAATEEENAWPCSETWRARWPPATCASSTSRSR